MRKTGLIILLFFIMACDCLAARSTIYYKGGVISVDPPKVVISKIYGIRLYPSGITIETSGKSAYFPHTIENLGNTTSKISVEIGKDDQAMGWSVELVEDENMNGVHESLESNPLKNNFDLGEGAKIHFFLKLTKPDNAKEKSICHAKIKAFTAVKDGGSYLGDNGIIYGGEDEVLSTDTMIVK
jgi:hypothetical protein